MNGTRTPSSASAATRRPVVSMGMECNGEADALVRKRRNAASRVTSPPSVAALPLYLR
ncbi:MAG: hypothetical protein ACKVQW_04835 [Pyrinomonadaceae bacterium]